MNQPLKQNGYRAARGLAWALLACCAFSLNSYAQDAKKAPPPPPPAPKPKPSSIAPPPYPPNDIDLKAAYCRPVIAANTAEHQRALGANLPPNLQAAAKERLAAAVDRGRRLEFYLLPRLNTLQSTALLDAQGRGYTDVASLVEIARNCDAKCGGTTDAAATACRQRCRESSDAAKRARECDDLSWLPLKDP